MPLYLKCVSVSKAKKTINKMKRQLTDWEKTSANSATDKGLIYKIYQQLNYKLKKNPSKKWAEDVNGHFFFREDIQMANKHMKTCNSLLIIREIQIKTIVRYHFTWVIMAIIKKSTNNKCWRRCAEKGSSYTTGGNVNKLDHYGKQYGGPTKN